MITHLLPDHIMDSLARAIPEKVTANMGTRWMLLADRAPKVGNRHVHQLLPGRRHGRDCRCKMAHRPSCSRSRPHQTAVRAVRAPDEAAGDAAVSLRVDSGGPGRYRGGLSQEIEIQNHAETKVDFTFYRPRVRHPAEGLLGGHGRRARADLTTTASRSRAAC